jgi:hypothetical protein
MPDKMHFCAHNHWANGPKESCPACAPLDYPELAWLRAQPAVVKAERDAWKDAAYQYRCRALALLKQVSRWRNGDKNNDSMIEWARRLIRQRDAMAEALDTILTLTQTGDEQIGAVAEAALRAYAPEKLR